MASSTDVELGLRVACVMSALAAFGVTDEARVKALVRITRSVPWYVPTVRGESPPNPPRLLFAAAVAKAALEQTFGAPGPGDIMRAAIEIGGTVRSDQGHTTERRWVLEAKDTPTVLGIAEPELRSIPAGPAAAQIGLANDRGPR